MRFAFVTLSLAVLALAPAGRSQSAQSAQRTVEPARFAGQNCVRLAEWAKANGFEVRWLKQDETLQLSNRWSKIVLAADSREAQINGVQVWLLYPVVAQNGALCLARLDVEATIRPFVSPPRNQPGAKVRTICLDPGHGGKDPGNEIGSNQEKQYTLLLAKEVRAQLAQEGLKVTLTRSTDSFVELSKRPQLAKRRGADLFISLHFNAAESGRSTVQGAEVYCLTPAGATSTNARGEGNGERAFPGNRHNDQNLFLAYQVQKALTRNLTVEDRGVRRARFAVLRDAVMPAALIEAGFLSHPMEGRQIVSVAYRQKIARAIVEGLLAYKRAVEQGT
jgi:N-acetylmuramoyl-L-alanine amidase